MSKFVKEYLVPYSFLLVLILLESKIISRFPEKKSDIFGIKKDPKNHSKETYYLNSPHILFYSSKEALDNTLINFKEYPFISNEELLSINIKIMILPKGESLDLYKAKDQRYFQDFIRYKDIEVKLQVNEKLLKSGLAKTETEKEIHPLARALNDIDKSNKARIEICIPFRDYAFREFITEDTQAAISEAIKQRNIDFLNFQIAQLKIQNSLKVLKSDLRGTNKEMNQCFSIETKDLKHYFLVKNLT